jgi:DNA-binding response OmpR family regulator
MPPASTSSAAPESQRPLTLLVIDDEPQIRRLLRITLEGHAYRVLEAANGRDGLLAAAQDRPDLILLDLGLPDLDGLSILRRIREWSAVPIVILTVNDREDDKVTALDAGDATHHLRVHIAHLRDKLEDDSASPTLILTEPGIGYRLTLDP